MSNEHFYEKHDEGSLKNSAEAEAGSNKATVTKPATVAVEDVQAQNLRCAQRLSLKGKVFLGGCAAALVLLLALAVTVLMPGQPAAILVDGQQVAVLKNQAQAEAVIADYLAEQSKLVGNEVFFAENVQVAEQARDDSEVLSRGNAEAVLAMTTRLKTNGAVIRVEGSQLLSVASVDIATEALDNLKKTYLPEDDTMQVLEVKFKQEVEVAPKEVFVSDLLNLDEAKLAMKDTSLTGTAPVTVLVILEKTKVEEVPYQTRFETDGTLRYGQTKTKQTGVNGSREVTIQVAQENGQEIARQEISSNTLVQAVDEIVLEGAVVRTASRSLQQATDAGMIWPTTATRISSYYGARSSDNHTGLDIDGETGDPVWAAKAGTVVTAGYYGSYGNQVVISHGDGMQTRYAHMQSIMVSVGDEVAIGQQVGTEGSTGRSTGSHLHFEVIIDGQTTDPLAYIK